MQLSTAVIMLTSAAVAAKHHSRSWVVDGCAKVGERQVDKEQDKHHLAAVRCCSYENSCHSKELGCAKQTYSDAKRTCARHGMRLCSWHEMKTNLCCGTGCNFDLEMAWILRKSYGKTPSEFDPNSLNMLTSSAVAAKHDSTSWTVDGCAKVGERQVDKEQDKHHLAPVRCCSNENSCHSKEIGCVKQTYSDAKHTCATYGMRLCSWHEMKTNLCCGTGCNFDLEMPWILKESYGKKPSEFDPNSLDNVKAWAVDGCAKVGDRKLDQEFDEHQVAPVRCCSMISDSKTSCHSKELGCVKQTYSDAKHTCADHGMRLCTWQEMKTNRCCGTGCNFDLDLAWVLRESYGNPHWPARLELADETNVTALV